MKVIVSRKATKFIRKLPPTYNEAIKERLKELETNIMPHGSISLTGRKNCFRIRVGPFRIQYQFFEEEKIILVYKIKRRDETTYKGVACIF